MSAEITREIAYVEGGQSPAMEILTNSFPTRPPKGRPSRAF